jgi:putative transposase
LYQIINRFSGGRTMRPTRNHYRQSTEKVNRNFALCVQKLFTAELHGYKITNKLIISILTAALCYCESLFSICQSIADFPTDKTIADNIIKLLPSYQKLQHPINTTLAEQLPNKFFKKAHRLAIDLVLIPYHGQHHRNENEVYRSQPKSGTSHFHAYATACVVEHGQRYTIAIIPVAKGTKMKDVVQALLKQCRSVGLKIKLLLLDRGFYDVSTISYLKKVQQPFLMPLVIRGKKGTKKRASTGTRTYAERKKQFWDWYRLTTRKKVGEEWIAKHTWFQVCVYCKNLKGQRDKHCRQSFAFAYCGVSFGKVKDFFEVYRKRFGIESSYRQSHQARIRTSTRNPLLRLFYFALSMLMRNEWTEFEREVLLADGRKKQMTSEYVSFKRLLGMIRRTLENFDCHFSPINSKKIP